MIDKIEEEKEVKVKKRGRRPKQEISVYELNKNQEKFFVDLSKDKESLKLVQDLLVRSNNKEFGREITFKDLAIYGLNRLTQKDIEKVQENGLTSMEKVEREFKKYNEKNNTNLELGEFLAKKLNIN